MQESFNECEFVTILGNRALGERDVAAVSTSLQYVERAEAQVLVELLSECKLISPVPPATALDALAEWLRVSESCAGSNT